MSSKRPETVGSVLKNAIYGVSTWILPLALSFVATPILVNSLGHLNYGIYALVIGVISYSFNFNIGRAITKYVAEYRAEGRFDKISEVVSATFYINLIVGGIALLILAVSARSLVTKVFQVAENEQNEAITAFYLSALIIFMTMVNQVFNAVLQGFQRFDRYSKIFNLNSLITTVGTIALALTGHGLVYLFGWNLIVLAVITGLTYWAARENLAASKLSMRPRLDIVKKVLYFSAGVIGYQFLANILLLFERGWIIRNLGEESLTYYVVPMSLGIYLHGFISSLLLVLFPLASELKTEPAKLARLYLKSTKIVCFFVVFIALTLMFESRYFLTLWMGTDFADRSANLLVAHTLTFAIAAVGVVGWQMTEGLGYPSYNSLVLLICLAISLTGMIWLTDRIGILGVAVGRLFGYAVLIIYILFVERRFFGKIQIGFWIRNGMKLLLAGGTAILLQKLLGWAFPFGWSFFLLSFAASGIAYCLVLWLLGFVTEEETDIFRKAFKL